MYSTVQYARAATTCNVNKVFPLIELLLKLIEILLMKSTSNMIASVKYGKRKLREYYDSPYEISSDIGCLKASPLNHI